MRDFHVDVMSDESYRAILNDIIEGLQIVSTHSTWDMLDVMIGKLTELSQLINENAVDEFDYDDVYEDKRDPGNTGNDGVVIGDSMHEFEHRLSLFIDNVIKFAETMPESRNDVGGLFKAGFSFIDDRRKKLSIDVMDFKNMFIAIVNGFLKGPETADKIILLNKGYILGFSVNKVAWQIKIFFTFLINFYSTIQNS